MPAICRMPVVAIPRGGRAVLLQGRRVPARVAARQRRTLLRPVPAVLPRWLCQTAGRRLRRFRGVSRRVAAGAGEVVRPAEGLPGWVAATTRRGVPAAEARLPGS